MQDKNVQAILFVILAAAVVGSACSTGEAARASALTCPPGMALAAKQPICIHGHCANGILDENEACDDGNLIAGDGCSPDCRSIETCGNGVVDHAVGEVCDDGNTESGDECCGDCRACPERMARLPTVMSAPAMQSNPDQGLPCPSSAPSDPPTPLLFTASMMLASSVSAGPVSHADTELPRMRVALERAQATAKRTETMATLEARERIRLAERLEQLIEQTQRDQETIAQLEQTLAERQEYIAAECQHFPNDRSDKLP